MEQAKQVRKDKKLREVMVNSIIQAETILDRNVKPPNIEEDLRYLDHQNEVISHMPNTIFATSGQYANVCTFRTTTYATITSKFVVKKT